MLLSGELVYDKNEIFKDQISTQHLFSIFVTDTMTLLFSIFVREVNELDFIQV